MMSSYSDVFGVSHDRGYDETIAVGDLVRTGPNLFPHFEVLAVHGDKAWLRNIADGADALAMTCRCRRLQPRILHAAA
jgi:hypothetical protein